MGTTMNYVDNGRNNRSDDRPRQQRGDPGGSLTKVRCQAEKIVPSSGLPPTPALPPPEEWDPPSGWSLPSEWALPLFAFGPDGIS
jgi:hypothetical protein